jgi:predicted ATPase
LTSFIRREQEKAEVRRLLSSARLITLTGAGGAGKTRLALQVAAEVLDDFPEGVWLAELAALTDPSLVPKAVASALDVPEQPGRDMTETLADALRQKALLLVLDNCEHLLTACADLAATLLRACPQSHIIATSREALGVPGETLWRVPSLSLPEDFRHLPRVEDLVFYDAVRLFVERAVATAPAFTVTNENAPAVAKVCKRLDGIPLAIELAAARVKVLAVEQIATRLDDRFRLLTAGSRMVLARHQTLRAAIDWSENLLAEPERALLRRLAVFAGGWTFEAAEAVCAGGAVEATTILDLLTSLVDKSLVLAETQPGEARYRLLETVRQYGWERLNESNEAAVVQGRHRDWYLVFAERAHPKLQGNEQDVWLDRLETEHDNLRAALASSTMAGNVEAGLRLVAALRWFWYINGHWTEGRRWSEEALSAGEGAEPSILIRAVAGAAMFAMMQGDTKIQREWLEKERILSKRLEDKETHIIVRVQMGSLALDLGEVERGVRLLEEALALGRGFGNKWGLAMILTQLADAVRIQGDHGRASTLYQEAIKLLDELGDKWRLSVVLRSMGIVSLRVHDCQRAASLYADSLRVRAPAKNKWVVFQSLEGLACVALVRGQYKRAAILFGAAKPIQEALRSKRDSDYQVEVDQSLDHTRTSLGENAFAAAFDEGRAMTLEQAIEYALQDASDESHV